MRKINTIEQQAPQGGQTDVSGCFSFNVIVNPFLKREIKFRMWNFVKENPAASKMFYDVAAVMTCLKQQILFDSCKTSSGYNYTEDGNAFMQFTNIIDEGGKYIYEGDIIQARYGPDYELNVFEIISYDASFVCFRKHKDPKVQFEQLPLSPSNSMEDVKVIGNIYENPELLIFKS